MLWLVVNGRVGSVCCKQERRWTYGSRLCRMATLATAERSKEERMPEWGDACKVVRCAACTNGDEMKEEKPYTNQTQKEQGRYDLEQFVVPLQWGAS